jgi:hypothetical protein
MRAGSPGLVEPANGGFHCDRRGITCGYFSRSDTGNSLCEAPPGNAPAHCSGFGFCLSVRRTQTARLSGKTV